ncbi:MAG: hypothetical protein ACE5JF_01995 [Anaerolineales bacterium]
MNDCIVGLKLHFLLPTTTLLLFGLACGRTAVPTASPTEVPTAAPTPSPYPTPIPPDATPEALPGDSDLRDLINYANAMQPIIADAGTILQSDGEILKEAEGGNDTVLCDGRLESDNITMKGIIAQARIISPPSDAQKIHDLVLQSGDAWTVALDNVELFCETGNAFYKVPAALKFWEAALTLQDAGNRIWALVISEGVQDWVRR